MQDLNPFILPTVQALLICLSAVSFFLFPLVIWIQAREHSARIREITFSLVSIALFAITSLVLLIFVYNQ
jgi:hypothetical protein